MRKLTLSLMLAGIISPTLSQAIGLGELVVDSGLNQPLNAEIELVETTPAEVNELTVRLAPAEIFKQIGIERPILLNKLVFTPTVENGRAIIKVNSLTPVTEPFLNFVVEVDWNQGKLLREYTVLLDPPTYTPSYAPVVTTPVNTIQEAEIVTSYEEPGVNTVTAVEPYDEFADLPMAETFPLDADIADTAYELTTSTDAATGTEDVTYFSLDDEAVYAGTETVTAAPAADPSYESLPDAETYPLDAGEAGSISDTDIGTSGYYTLDDSIETASTYEVIPGYESDEIVYAASAGGEYHVEKGDTLWDIATSNAAGVSAQQMMIALLRVNPDAFIDGNINRLKSGYILRIPDTDNAAEIPGRKEALAEVKSQNALWNQYRGVMATRATGQQTAAVIPGGRTNAANQNVAAPTPPKDVSIVVPNANDNKVIQLEKEITFAREQQQAAARKNTELNEQVAELQALLDKKDQLLAMQGQGSEGANPEDTLKIQQLEGNIGEINDDLSSATQRNAELETQITALKQQLQEKDTLITVKDQKLASLEDQVKVAPVSSSPELPEGEDITKPNLFANLKENPMIMYGGAGLLALLGLVVGLLSHKKRKVRKAVEELNQFEFEDSNIPDELDDLQPQLSETGILEMDVDIQSEFGQESQLDQDIEVSEDDLISDAEHVLDNLDDTASLDNTDFASDFKAEDTNVIHAEFGDEDVTEADLTGEFPVIDDTEEVSSPANEEDELLAEVDIYLAYGLHDQVIEELKPRLEEEPGREDYQIRLFKAYFEKKDKESFAREAEVLKSTISTSSQLWKDVAILGFSLDASNSLYAEGDGSAISASDLIPDKPAHLDIDVNVAQGNKVNNDSMGFHETEVIEPYSVSPEELAMLDDDAAIEDELVETVILEETGLQSLRDIKALDAKPGGVEAATSDPKDDTGSIDFNLDDLSVDDTNSNISALASEISAESGSEMGDRKLSEETTEFEFDLASMKGLDMTATGADEDLSTLLEDIDLDATIASDSPDSVQETKLGDLNFDISDSGETEVPDMSQTIRISDQDKEALNLADALDGIEGDLPVVSGDDDMNTKLDLAKAYVDMGDDEGARDALNEVIASGNEQQKVEAERLLNQLT